MKVPKIHQLTVYFGIGSNPGWNHFGHKCTYSYSRHIHRWVVGPTFWPTHILSSYMMLYARICYSQSIRWDFACSQPNGGCLNILWKPLFVEALVSNLNIPSFSAHIPRFLGDSPLARLPLSYLHRQNLMCRPLHPNRVAATRAIPAGVTRAAHRAHRAINKQLQYRRCMPRCCNNNSFNNFNSNRWCKVPRWPRCNELKLPTKLQLQLPSGCHKWVWPKPKRTSCGCSTSRANQCNPCGKSQCLCRNWRDTTQAGPMGGWKCWATKIQVKWSRAG